MDIHPLKMSYHLLHAARIKFHSLSLTIFLTFYAQLIKGFFYHPLHFSCAILPVLFFMFRCTGLTFLTVMADTLASKFFADVTFSEVGIRSLLSTDNTNFYLITAFITSVSLCFFNLGVYFIV